MDVLTVARSQYNPGSEIDTYHVEMPDMDGISIISNIHFTTVHSKHKNLILFLNYVITQLPLPIS